MIAEGVNLSGLKPEMAIAHTEAKDIFRARGADAVITSGLEGKHSRKSLHYVGYALDYRIRHVIKGAPEIAAALARTLGRQYDVVLKPDHIHVEFQPKGS